MFPIWSTCESDFLITKKDIQLVDKKGVLDLSILDLQKGFVNVVCDFLWRDKEKMTRNQMVGHYMKGLKIRIVESKRKECKVGLFDQN